MEHFYNSGTAFSTQTKIESNNQKCKIQQMNVSTRHRDSANIHSYNPVNRADSVASQWQTNEHSCWRPSDFNLWTVVEPRLWTSLSMRRNCLYAPNIICFPSRGVSGNPGVDCIAYRGCTFSRAYGNGEVRQTVQTGNDYPNTCFTSCESDIPHYNIFHRGGSIDTENTRREYVDSFNAECDVYSNGSEEDEEEEDVRDDYSQVECELCNNDDEECDIISNHDNLPVGLGDLDCILRMLPSTLIDLKHMTDEEVALIMYNHDDDDEDEEILSLNIIHEDVHDARLPNPVASLLERTANEYFLPIVCDTRKDKR